MCFCIYLEVIGKHNRQSLNFEVSKKIIEKKNVTRAFA